MQQTLQYDQEVKLEDGRKLELAAVSASSPHLKPEAWLRKNVRHDWLTVECGAGYGKDALLSGALAVKGNVFALEPAPARYEILLSNIRHNKIRNVIPLKAAAGSKSGAMKAKVLRDAEGKLAETAVEFLTVDDLAAQYKLPKLDLLKINCGAFALEALRGARQTLEKFRPRLLLRLENPRLLERQDSDTSALRWLAEHGYSRATLLDEDWFLIQNLPGTGPTGEQNKKTFTLAFPGVSAATEHIDTETFIRPVSLEFKHGFYSAVIGNVHPVFRAEFWKKNAEAEKPAANIRPAFRPLVLDVNEELFEWISLIDSVLTAKKQYVIMELGAGYGRWIVQAAHVLRQYNNVPFKLVGVEAEPTHFAWMKTALLDNGLNPDDHELVEGALSSHGEKYYLTVKSPQFEFGSTPSEWYGQCIFDEATVKHQLKPGGGATGQIYCGKPVLELQNAYGVIEINSIHLGQLINRHEYVNLIDMDIQGAELGVVQSAVREIDARVKRVHIGTHNPQVEDGLRAIFDGLGWKKVWDFRCLQENETPLGPCQFQDGVLSYLNPKIG